MTTWYITYTFQRVTGNREIESTRTHVNYENIHDAIKHVENQMGKYLISIDEVIRRG
ncbi:hypothetical protein HB818_14310 [Listeria booriae]|uniref:hypothetical protein n=1 Tax=Listeria booriae TaxID=1552123 RepID=UPI001624DAA8|nr:hypothetical protein [Listeria booriae]MBC1286932.1 hypothetical protein [Listeria booriae]